MSDSWPLLGDVLAKHKINMQTQYASRYLTGVSSVQFGADLRVDLSDYENGGNYHVIRIHPDDALIFVRRLREHRQSLGAPV